MIKINLAGASSVPSFVNPGASGAEMNFSDDAIRKEALKRLLIILLLPVGLWLYEYQNLPAVGSQLAVKRKELSELTQFNSKASASVAEIKKFKEDEAKIQQRIAVLDKISKDRLREVRILDLFQQVIPERVWFTSLEVQGSKVSMIGLAMSEFDVSNFMENISKSAFLMDVNLLSSSEQIIDGVNLKKFEISCVTERSRE